MSKREVMQSLRNDFDQEVLPYYNSIRLKLQSLLKARSEREKKPINLGWEPYETKNKTKFHILKKGDKDGTYSGLSPFSDSGDTRSLVVRF